MDSDKQIEAIVYYPQEYKMKSTITPVISVFIVYVSFRSVRVVQISGIMLI